jgi:hypothetical protein
MRIHSNLFALTMLGLIAGAAPAKADTAIATRWRAMGETQDDCMNHAAMAIFRAGFDKSAPASQSMSGKRGEYAASIRCVAEQRIVFFVTSGPSPETTARYLDELYGHF